MSNIEIGDVYQSIGCDCYVISHIHKSFMSDKLTYDVIFYDGNVYNNLEEDSIKLGKFIKHYDDWRDFLTNNKEN